MLTELKNLALRLNKEKYPNLPDHARAIHNYTDKTANGLTRCILDFLKFSGWQAERISCTGRFKDNRKVVTDVIGRQRMIGSTQYIPSSMQPGTADISATIAGKSVKIEIKIGKDKQSESQKNYQSQVENSGGIYYIAKSFDEFFWWYNEKLKQWN